MNETNDPNKLTPLERYWDDILRFENRERYVQQSATGVLPPRERAREAA
jgi:hypothetical protein